MLTQSLRNSFDKKLIYCLIEKGISIDRLCDYFKCNKEDIHEYLIMNNIPIDVVDLDTIRHLNNLLKESLNSIKKRKKLQTFINDLTLQDVIAVYLKQGKKYALTGVQIDDLKNVSIDRIDSNLGYTKNNIQLVSVDINFMKGLLNQTDFINNCKLIADFMFKADSNN